MNMIAACCSGEIADVDEMPGRSAESKGATDNENTHFMSGYPFPKLKIAEYPDWLTKMVRAVPCRLFLKSY